MAVCGLSGAANAAEDAAASAAAEPIVITGRPVHYGIRSTATATRTQTDIRNVPQALSVISEAQIEDQQLRSVADVLNFIPGASYNSGEGNRDTLVLRGNSSTADFFVDGVRDDVQYFRDFYNVERVEVLKGPNAMIFGRGGGGGVFNRVLKRPGLTDVRQVRASADGFGGFRLTGDVDHAFNGAFGLRVNGLYEDGASFRDHVRSRRYGINPTVAVLAGPNTRVDLSFEHFHDRRTADRGVPADGPEPLRGYDRTFFGDPDHSFARADVDLASLTVEHDFGAGVKLRSRTLHGDYRKFYQNVYPTAYDPATGLVTLGAYNNRNDRTNLFSQNDLIWTGPLAGIDQTLLLGFEIGRQSSRNQRMTGTLVGGNIVAVGDPTVSADVSFAPVASDANNRVHAALAAAYVQEQIRPALWLEIVAGIRLDSFAVTIDDLRGAGSRFKRRDTLWSPRLGVVLKPSAKLSLYASASRSFLPQSGDQFSGLTAITQGLEPERFDNREIGGKWELLDGLLATAAIYQLDRTNTRATDPLDPSHTVLTGRQRSRGLELGLERSVTSRWMISGGYTLQKAEITQTTTAAPAGREAPLVPRHSFSLWNRFDLTRNVGVGLGLIARSKSFASISNAVTLPGYARVDAALFYRLPGGIQAQVNAENLLGAHYFPAANSDNNIAPGAPRTIKATLGYSF
ncbi:MAG: TonB-dependent siderophore receptor [Sphingomicrobium sp.]